MSKEISTPNVSFLTLSDISLMKDTEIYKLLDDDISFIDSFLSLQNIPLNTPEFNAKADDFNINFVSYLQRKSQDYHWVLNLLYFLAQIRPKLIGIFPNLLNSFYSIYSSQKEEINEFILDTKKKCIFSIFI